MIDCPQCHTASADDAEFCGLCFTKFQSQPKPATGPVPRNMMMAQNIQIKYNDWLIYAHLLISDKIYFFVKDWKNTKKQTKTLARIIVEAGLAKAGVTDPNAAIVVGNMMGRIVERLPMDSSPMELFLEDMHKVPLEIQDVIKQFPALLLCMTFFAVEKSYVGKISFNMFGKLVIKTQLYTLEVEGEPLNNKDKIARHLALNKFSVS